MKQSRQCAPAGGAARISGRRSAARVVQAVGSAAVLVLALVSGAPNALAHGNAAHDALRAAAQKEQKPWGIAGDARLLAKLQTPELLPVASRIRTQRRIDYLTPEQLGERLGHLLEQAGAPKLLTPPLAKTLCEHAAGNLRTLTSMANEMLLLAMRRESQQLDEALYFETFALDAQATKRRRS